MRIKLPKIKIYFEVKRRNGWLKIRILEKKKFIEKHKRLCKQSFKFGGGHKDYKTKYGYQLIELARKELNYKDTTYSGDIYYGLFMTYKTKNYETNRI